MNGAAPGPGPWPCMQHMINHMITADSRTCMGSSCAYILHAWDQTHQTDSFIIQSIYEIQL